jgi:hypothetical protein
MEAFVISGASSIPGKKDSISSVKQTDFMDINKYTENAEI